MTKFGRFVWAVNTSVYPAIGQALMMTLEAMKIVLEVVVLLLMAIVVFVVGVVDWLRPPSAEEMNADGTKDQRYM